MILRRAILFGLSLALVASTASAGTQVIRDSIGPDSSLTDGMGGGLTHHDGLDWNTPGLVVTAPEDGKLTEARFVIFARGPGPVFPPENNLANIYGFPMEFHIWTDGVEGGADSFDLNPLGSAVPGHIGISINTPTESFITVVPFGQTGLSNEFTTFLVTVDLSSFDIELEGGKQYVMGLIQDNQGNFITGSGIYRISASRAVGFEDVFRAFNTNPALRPGYVKSQLSGTFEQYAGSFTLGNADFDGDDDVDGLDFLEWQRNYGQAVSAAQDSNGDGLADDKDLANWEQQYGQSWTPPLAVSQSVPEPATWLLAALTAPICVRVARRRGWQPRETNPSGLLRGM